MNIEIIALCDAATDQQGKLNILGAFDTVFTKSLPTVHTQCAVRCVSGSEGSSKVRIESLFIWLTRTATL